MIDRHSLLGRRLAPALVLALLCALAIACDRGGSRGPGGAGVSDTAAYQTAMQTQDAAARTAAFEGFLAHYPQSIFRAPVYRRLYDLKAADNPASGMEFLRQSLKREKDPEARASLHYALFQQAMRTDPKAVKPTVETILADRATLPYELMNAVSWDLAAAGQEPDLALELAERAVVGSTDTLSKATTLDTRGYVHLQRREFPLAIDDFKAARALIPEPIAEIEDHLAQAYAASGDKKAARQVYLDLLVEHESPELRGRIAALTQDIGGSPAEVFAEVDQRRDARATVAKDFTLVDYAGKKIRLSALRGQVVLVNFWHPT
jgi:tetratricopeptide (TPR) repeat protein